MTTGRDMADIAIVTAAGVYATLQDGGRRGLRHLGAPLSGPADRLSMALANVAVGNPPFATAIESAQGGVSFTFVGAATIAVAGAPTTVSVNGASRAMFEAFACASGDVLDVGHVAKGVYVYIAVAGGLAGDVAFGSTATLASARLGGVDGRSLQAGDVLALAGAAAGPSAAIPHHARPVFARETVLRATPGPEFDTNPVYARFFAEPFTVGDQASRMGVRMTGPAMAAAAGLMNSSPVFPGTVQCPPDGAPIALLADAQTTGGYPRIAQIVEPDIRLAAQARHGDRIWFREVSTAEAADIRLRSLESLRLTITGFNF